MQFLPATFAAYGVDGDGDGAVSIRSDADSVFLPFEGDTGIAIILSKAFLLANDTAIDDHTITSQINPR